MAHSSAFKQFRRLLLNARNTHLAETGRTLLPPQNRRQFLKTSALGGISNFLIRARKESTKSGEES